jgi:spoIIIJ-associated protein
MKEVREFEAADLEGAIRAAAEELGVESADIQYEISAEGSKGFLGVGSKPVRIIVTLPESEMVEKSGRDETTIDQEILELQKVIVKRMGLSLSVVVETSEENVEISMSGRDRDMVLEKRAELLEAFQYLLNRIFSKRLDARRVVVDCDGFRKRKEEELQLIARRISEKVKLTGMEQELGLMNPYERRIVHLAVAKEEGVSSESSGEGFMKRVTIMPSS